MSEKKLKMCAINKETGEYISISDAKVDYECRECKKDVI